MRQAHMAEADDQNAQIRHENSPRNRGCRRVDPPLRFDRIDPRATSIAQWHAKTSGARDRLPRHWPDHHASWQSIVPLGFDDPFKRLWEFYLHYCEAGLRAEYIDVRQVLYRT
jgi:hypothetical protein